jgi:NADPH:quinone reductase-like Zn-dependent oxidoreductase
MSIDMIEQTASSRATRTMKAVVSRVYGPIETVHVEQVARPTPGPGQVLVRNHASVVTAAMCEARSGQSLTARLYFGLRKPKWPVLGTNFAGRVEAVGPDVTGFRVGERVAGVTGTDFGAYAEYVLVSAGGVIGKTPDGLSDEDAVAVFDGSMTALPFIRDVARLQAGQSILVNGAAGAVGSAAVQLAKHYGATVTAVCSTDHVGLMKSLGADAVIDRTRTDFTANADSYDVVFDAVGKSSFLRARAALKRGGLYLTTVPSLAILLQMLWTSRLGSKRATILFTGLAKPAVLLQNLLFIGELASERILNPVIGSTTPMERTAEIYDHVGSGRKIGSAVVTFGDAA